MAGTTPKRGLPFPSNADVPNIAGDLNALATAVDTKLGSAGKCIITTEETRSTAGYGFLTTHDVVTGIVLPTDGLIFVAFQGMWKRAGASTVLAGIFIGANLIKVATENNAAPIATAAALNTAVNTYTPLHSIPGGLYSETSTVAYTGDVTTGQLVGSGVDPNSAGGFCAIFAAAGSYDVSLQWSAAATSVTAKNRKLWVWTQPF